MEIKVFRHPRVFQQLKEAWTTLLHETSRASVFLSPEWLASWWQAFGRGDELEVITFWQGNRLKGIAPFRRKKEKLIFLASPEVTDYGDFIFSPKQAEEVCRLFLDFLREGAGRTREVHFLNVPSSSPLLKFLPTLTSQPPEQIEVKPAATVLKLELPPDYDEFQARLKRKVRHELRRKRRRLTELNQMRIEEITSPGESLALLDDFIRLHSQRDRQKMSFWAQAGIKDFFQALFKRMTSSGWLVILGLRCQQSYIAYLIQFDFQDRIYLYNVAFDCNYARFSPGIILFDEAIRRAIIRGKKEVDFLRGQERYKLEFGVSPDQVYNVSLVLGEE